MNYDSAILKSRGKPSPGLKKAEINRIVKTKFKEIGQSQKEKKFTHTLFHNTAGLLMYDGILSEFIQKL